MNISSIKQYANYAKSSLAGLAVFSVLLAAPFVSLKPADAAQWVSAQKCVEIHAQNPTKAHDCVNNSVEAMVYRAYKVVFGRRADQDQSGYRYWVSVGNAAVKKGQDPVTAVISGMMKSPEYGNKIMTGNNKLWVTELYQRSFSRKPAVSEVAYWEKEINTGRRSHNYVLRFFTQSQEAKKLYAIPAVCFAVDSDLVCHY